MKKFKFGVVVGLLLLLCTGLSQGAEYDLGIHGKLVLDLPEGWKVTAKDPRSSLCALHLLPANGTNVLCTIVANKALKPPLDRQSTEVMARKMAEAYLAGRRGGIVEKTIELKEFKLKSGYGYYTTFTEANLVGKPSVKGDFKILHPGFIALSPEIQLGVGIMGDDVVEATFKQAMDIVQSARLKEK